MDGASPPLRLLAANLSRGGMFVRAPAPLPHGTRVAVAIDVRGVGFPFAAAEVVWASEGEGPERRTGFGLRFVEMKPSAAALLEHLIRIGGAQGRRETPAQILGPLPRLGDFEGVEPVASVPVPVPVPVPAPAPESLTRSAAGPVVLAAALAAIAVCAALFVHTQRQSSAALALEDLPAPQPPATIIVPAPIPMAAPEPPGDSVALPDGPARALVLREGAGTLVIEPKLLPGARIERAFVLANPPRLVIDLAGPAVSRATRLEGAGRIGDVRLGQRPGGARVVLDLTATPRAFARDGDRLTLR